MLKILTVVLAGISFFAFFFRSGLEVFHLPGFEEVRPSIALFWQKSGVGPILGRALGDSVKNGSEELVNLAKSMPDSVLSQMPKIEELISPTKKEELYLKAPKTLSLPEVTAAGFDQELTIQLTDFEVKDTRRAGSWSLLVTVRDLVGEKGEIPADNFSFRMKAAAVDSGGDRVSDLVIEEGKALRISASGSAKGVFRFRPFLTLRIPQGSYSGSYKAEIESVLE